MMFLHRKGPSHQKCLDIHTCVETPHIRTAHIKMFSDVDKGAGINLYRTTLGKGETTQKKCKLGVREPFLTFLMEGTIGLGKTYAGRGDTTHTLLIGDTAQCKPLKENPNFRTLQLAWRVGGCYCMI